MKLSLVVNLSKSNFISVLSQEELFHKMSELKSLGYDGIELGIRDPEQVELKFIIEAAKENLLEIPAIGTGLAFGEDGLSFVDADKKIRKKAIERVKSHIEFASYLSANVIIGLVRGRRDKSFSLQKTEDFLISALLSCADFARNFIGMYLLLEPINRYETNLINNVSSAIDIINKIEAPNIALLLDTFHMNIEEPNIEKSILHAGSLIKHFHIADSNRWPPGCGHINFKRILRTLNKIGYKGYLSAEILPLPNEECAMKMTVENMRKIQRF